MISFEIIIKAGFLVGGLNTLYTAEDRYLWIPSINIEWWIPSNSLNITSEMNDMPYVI